MANKNLITQGDIKFFEESLSKDAGRIALRNAIIKNGINSVSQNFDSVADMRHEFSVEIKTGKITNQFISGRCWLFAGLNLLRQKIMNKYNIKNFELSQNYPMFFDKLEKANFFLENILDTLDEDKYSRIIMWLLKDPIQDGGQWDMFVNIVNKYGAVPKDVMPETFNTQDSRKMIGILTLKLREQAAELRKLHSNKKDLSFIRKRKQKMLSEIYTLLTHFLGVPPKKFNFEFRDKDKKFHQALDLTPKSFYDKYLKIKLDDYVSLINVPTEDRPFNKTYTIEYLGNVFEGNPILYVNTDLTTLKKVTMDQVKKEEPVWFGCDVEKMLDRKAGILDSSLYLYEQALGVPFRLGKGERVEYGESKLTHAMVFTGVNLVRGKPNRWRVENSWGEDDGKKGYYVMSDKWFDDYVYQVVIHKKFLPEKIRNLIKKKPIVLPPWDPMGSLAIMK